MFPVGAAGADRITGARSPRAFRCGISGRRSPATAGILLLSVLLAACRFDPELGFLSSLVEPEASPSVATTGAVSTGILSTGAIELPVAVPVAVRIPPRPAITLDPDWPLNQTGPELRRLLGAPSFVREDASAHLWRYRTPHCILNMFLYRDAHQIRVTHSTFLTPALKPVDDVASREECIADLLQRKPARRAPATTQASGAILPGN